MDLPYQNHPYWEKDATKASKANKFIGFGAKKSSTEYYRVGITNGYVNCGEYTSEDVVFVSVNGERPNRVKVTDPTFWNELALAIDANVMFITDTPADRARYYNVGERELAVQLAFNGYEETRPGIWVKVKT